MMQDSLAEIRDFARRLASDAQAIAQQFYGRATASQKADGSDVTDADVAVQKMMIEGIAAAYPDHAIIAEEGEQDGRNAPSNTGGQYCWVIDPIDGTRNYVRGVPVFATSVAVLMDGAPVVGVVRSLTTGDEYVAVRGGGAQLNGRSIRVETDRGRSGTMVAVQSTAGNDDTGMFRTLSGFGILRNLGSTALHMALVAAGAFDGTLAYECKLWDIAAGALLVEEAGGVYTGWAGEPVFPIDATSYRGTDMPFVAARPDTHDRLLAQAGLCRPA